MSKNYTLKFLCVILTFAWTTSFITAQNQIAFNLGLSSYEGDLHCFEDTGLSFLNSSGVSFGAEYLKQLKKPISISLAYQFAQFKGDDSAFSAESSHPLRGFNFKNNLHEVTARLYIEPMREKRISPYFSAGLGFALNNPNTFFDFDNQSSAVQSLISQDEDEISKLILAVPLSLGLNFKVSEVISLGAEFGWRLGLSDYLDGVAASASGSHNDYFGTGVVKLAYTLGTGDGKMKTPKYKTPNSGNSEDKVMSQPEPDNGGEVPEIVMPTPESAPTVEEIVVEVEEIAKVKQEEPPVVVREPVVSETPPSLPEPKVDIDTDGDGFIDRLDNCPQLFSRTNSGCPTTAVTSDVNCGATFGERVVNFQTSFSDLSNEDKAALNSIVDILFACESKKLIIEGYTDSRGSELVNQDLSEKRARSVKGYIASRGIDASRIKVYGFGETKPIADNKTKEGQAKNRRVVVAFF